MTVSATTTVEATGTVALDRLDPKHWPNPRGDVDTASPAFLELVASIAAQGMLEPIGIGPALAELGDRHPIIYGWRRYTAALDAGVDAVPYTLQTDITDEASALRAALAENLAREGMTPLAEASAIARLVELGDTQVAAAAAVGVSERTARERVRLLELPRAVRQAIDAGHIPTTCTRQLQLIADVSAATATAIAKRMAKGETRASDILEPDRLHIVLRSLDCKHGLVELRYGQHIKALGLPPARAKALRTRNKKAAEYAHDGGDYIDLSAGQIGKKLVDAARSAGQLLTVAVPNRGNSLYLSGSTWIDRAVEAAVEKAERAAAARKSARARTTADKQPAAADPEAQARAEHAAAVAAIAERARPHAVAMNAELGERLRNLRSCSIDGPVGHLVLHCVASPLPIGQIASEGYQHVDPARKLAANWATMPPAAAAAELVAALTAGVFGDPRATRPRDDTDGLSPGWFVRDIPEDLVGDAAAALGLLPDRAIALLAARSRLKEQRLYHRLRGSRRRLLFELTKVKAGLAPKAFAAAAREWTSDVANLDDVRRNVCDSSDFAAALEQLVDAGHVKAVDDGARYLITAAGRKDLAATGFGPAAPIMQDIDAGATAPALPGATPATEDPQDDDDVGNGVTRRSQALAVIGARPGITIPELAAEMGVKQNYLYRLVPGLADEGLLRKEGRGWFLQLELAAGNDAASSVVIVHVTPTHGTGEPAEAELQPDPPKGKSNSRKVIYTASRTAAWVAETRIIGLPAVAVAA